MNKLETWFESVKKESPEVQDRVAMIVAGVLTLIISYFLIMYWYTQFTRATDISQQQAVGSVAETKGPSFLETAQNKFVNFFKNEQLVE